MTSGDASFTLPKVGMSGEVWVPVTGDAAFEAKAIAEAGTGQVGVQGDSAFILAAIAEAGTGKIGTQGAIAFLLKAVVESGTGNAGVQGAAAFTLKKLALAAVAAWYSQSNEQVGEPEVANGVNHQSGAKYDIRHSDRECLVLRYNAGAMTDTIPQAVGAFGHGWRCYYHNFGPGTATISPVTSQINFGSSLVVAPGCGVIIWADGEGDYQIVGSIV